MNRLLGIIAALFVSLLALVGIGWWRGMVVLPFGPNHRELVAQLRDRGTVAVAGPIPFGVPRDQSPLRNYRDFPELRAALEGTRDEVAARALRDGHFDGLLVRTDHPQGPPGSVLARMSQMLPVREIGATYVDDTAAVYEVHDSLVIEPADAHRLVEVVRLVLQGAVPPPDRLFSPVVRRANPAEVAVIVREGREPILWRAVRGGSIGRALIDATYAVLDRWTTRQQQRYGPIREAILTHPITIAIFNDRGTLGSRTQPFLRSAVDPHRFSLGFEHLGRWEYVLPPSPWAPIPDPVRAIGDLAREHDVPPPGYLRAEIVLYRFRAYQLIERTAQGDVDVFEPM